MSMLSPILAFCAAGALAVAATAALGVLLARRHNRAQARQGNDVAPAARRDDPRG